MIKKKMMPLKQYGHSNTIQITICFYQSMLTVASIYGIAAKLTRQQTILERLSRDSNTKLTEKIGKQVMESHQKKH